MKAGSGACGYARRKRGFFVQRHGKLQGELGLLPGIMRIELEHVLPPPAIYHSCRKMIRRSSAICLLLLPACSVSQDEEVALGRENAAQINAQLPIVRDAVVSAYLQNLGESIARKTSRADLDWHFYLVNTKDVNAFALPGGFVYVNRGLVESTDRLDELAGTLGHEIGHVIQRHSVKQMEKAQKANLGVAAV